MQPNVSQTADRLRHSGTMYTKVDNCQFVCIAKEDFYKILHQVSVKCSHSCCYNFFLVELVRHGGSVVSSVPCVRMVAGSDPTIAASAT